MGSTSCRQHCAGYHCTRGGCCLLCRTLARHVRRPVCWLTRSCIWGRSCAATPTVRCCSPVHWHCYYWLCSLCNQGHGIGGCPSGDLQWCTPECLSGKPCATYKSHPGALPTLVCCTVLVVCVGPTSIAVILLASSCGPRGVRRGPFAR